MDLLFEQLRSIEDKYSRTIFNFHLVSNKDVSDVYPKMRELISNETLFDRIVTTDSIKNSIKKIIYCDIHLTKHVINSDAYPTQDTTNASSNYSKIAQFFDVKTNDDEISMRTAYIFERDKSSLVSYIKTTNKKRKIDYGEIKKTIHSTRSFLSYFSGKKSDDYLSTTIKSTECQPWIKTISKRMRIDIVNNAIITKGKSSILQTIEIVFANRTCVKIFKDSTMHIILSKDKNEKDCVGIINKLFDVYKVLFCLLYNIVQNDAFLEIYTHSETIIALETFEEKINKIKDVRRCYGVYNFKVGMFNLTFNKPIEYTVFPSLLVHGGSKIKFFKGKKLNIVALRSLEECVRYIELTESIMKKMEERSAILNGLNIETVDVDALKTLLS
ncbi:M113R [Myxoma virus]|nr:m113R [Myxoma virus]WLM68567.1 M113R [Myxoma virus]WNN26994.1 M113R [Myxoma virus]